ncbi:MAG: MogA/MoaB family molybdenum cofactor biosynthesis protein [Microthrixaceae bacterium]
MTVDAGATNGPSDADHHGSHPDDSAPLPRRPQAKVLTVSDRVVAGTREDVSGVELAAHLEAAGFEVLEHRVIADGVERVSNTLSYMALNFVGLIATTGGTGFGHRDETPEGTRRILDKTAPGFTTAMATASPLNRLSRGVAGVRGRALILNLPGSPKGAIETIDAVLDVVPHAVALMSGHQDPHPTD